MDERIDAFMYLISTPRHCEKSSFDAIFNSKQQWPSFFGIDWAADSGMLRGEITKIEGNVVHVRFKDAGV